MAKTPFCFKIRQYLIIQHDQEAPFGHQMFQILFALALQSMLIYWAAKVQLSQEQLCLHWGFCFSLTHLFCTCRLFSFFFFLSGLIIWASSACSKSCLLPCTYSCPEGLSSVGASTHFCSLGELWFLKIDRKLCSFPLVYFFEWQWKRSVLAVWKNSWKTISGCQPSFRKMRWALWCLQKRSCVLCVPPWNFLQLEVSTLRWDSSVL